MTPPHLFVALLNVALNSDRLRERVAVLLAEQRRAALGSLLPTAIDGADWLVERLDLSNFAPHVSLQTLAIARRVLPHCSEFWLTPARQRRNKQRPSVFSIAMLRPRSATSMPRSASTSQLANGISSTSTTSAAATQRYLRDTQ